jgi:hypothetical protein
LEDAVDEDADLNGAAQIVVGESPLETLRTQPRRRTRGVGRGKLADPIGGGVVGPGRGEVRLDTLRHAAELVVGKRRGLALGVGLADELARGPAMEAAPFRQNLRVPVRPSGRRAGHRPSRCPWAKPTLAWLTW